MSIQHNEYKSTVHSIKPGDPYYMIDDGIMQCPRAGIEIVDGCPDLWKDCIVKAYNNGYLKPFANVTEKEMLFMGLTKTERNPNA